MAGTGSQSLELHIAYQKWDPIYVANLHSCRVYHADRRLCSSSIPDRRPGRSWEDIGATRVGSVGIAAGELGQNGPGFNNSLIGGSM